MKLLEELLIIFGISVVVLIVCNRLKISSIIGLLITGVIAGPGVLSLVSSLHDVEILAEIGIILLLFTIGLEFSIRELLHLKRSFLLGGTLQVCGTIAIIFVLSLASGVSIEKSLVFGFIIALSSTAIILKLFQEKSVFDTLHGKPALGILLFQDIIVVPMMLLTSFLAGSDGYDSESVILFLLKSAAVIAFVIAGYKWIVPHLFYQVSKTRSRELFILSVVVFCFAVAWLTYSIGLSLALGAFIAGLLVSTTEYSQEALGNVIPFKEVFLSIFFVSVGMLIDVNVLMEMPVKIISASLLLMALKFILIFISVILTGYPLRTSLLVGFSLCQIGEFSFILAKTGADLNLISHGENQFILSVIILSMLVTPFIVNNYERLADLILKIPFPDRLKRGLFSESINNFELMDTAISGHVIIVGYGVNGRNVSRATKKAGIPYVIIEMNPDTVKEENRKGESIYFGDASNENVLEHANIGSARVIVIAVPDAATVRRIVQKARKLNRDIYIIARTRFVQEIEELYKIGSDDVIPEEYETSVEIFSRVLNQYRIPQNDIMKMIGEIRGEGYGMFRSYSPDLPGLSTELGVLKGMEVTTIRVEEGAPASGKTISESAVRKSTGVSIIVIQRGEEMIKNPDGDTKLLSNDILWLIGSEPDICGSFSLFRCGDEGGEACLV